MKKIILFSLALIMNSIIFGQAKSWNEFIGGISEYSYLSQTFNTSSPLNFTKISTEDANRHLNISGQVMTYYAMGKFSFPNKHYALIVATKYKNEVEYELSIHDDEGGKLSFETIGSSLTTDDRKPDQFTITKKGNKYEVVVVKEDDGEKTTQTFIFDSEDIDEE
jgi:hypothetical protein